jgi:hypothetical protein
MALALLIAISGPKKSRFSGPALFNDPSNGFARIKIIKTKCPTTGTLIVIFLAAHFLTLLVPIAQQPIGRQLCWEACVWVTCISGQITVSEHTVTLGLNLLE